MKTSTDPRHRAGHLVSLKQRRAPPSLALAVEAFEARELVRSSTREHYRLVDGGECARLFGAARALGHRFALAVWLALNAGLRATELRALHHEDLRLDGEEPYLRVRQTHGRMTKAGRERTVPLAKAFAEELRALEVGPPREGPVFHAPGSLRSGRPRGRPTEERCVGAIALERWVRRVREVAGLGEDVSLNALRHTFCSRHVQAGVSIAKTAKRAGRTVAVSERLVPGGDADAERAGAALPSSAIDARATPREAADVEQLAPRAAEVERPLARAREPLPAKAEPARRGRSRTVLAKRGGAR